MKEQPAVPQTTTEAADHLIVKRGYYYRPNRAGYTMEVSAAGRYTKSEAEREASVEPWHMKAVPLASVPGQIENPYTLATDPTAQAEPLTEGQTIVAKWMTDMIAEPCELAVAIDMALIEAWDRGRERI